jgi:hypothetical protein
MRSAALAQTANKPDCFRQAISHMQQRCADLDRLEEDKISCGMNLGTAHISRLTKVSSCDFYDFVRTGTRPSLASDGVSLGQTKDYHPSGRQASLRGVGLTFSDNSHTTFMSPVSGHLHEVRSPGLVTLDTSESQVSPDSLVPVTALLTTHLARMCYAYQQLHDIGI